VTTLDPSPPTRAEHGAVARPALRGGVPATVRAYVALTKPRIIELLLVTTLPTMILAKQGMPSLGLVLATMIGGTLAAGSANALNCYLDRDIDAVMGRTVNRPLATGALPARNALVFGVALGALAVGLLAVTVNLVSALLALAAILFYVVVYTMWLKRRTPQNIVWGGAAGCMPVLIGWSAVTGGLTWAPVVLFGVIFLWTPPHYWPLSMRFKKDYAAAGVPMLPVVAEPVNVTRQIVLYGWAMVACSLLLVPVGGAGWFYGVTAAVLGGYFMLHCHRLYRAAAAGGSGLKPMGVFHASITYLTLLFMAIAIDPFLPF
jgi:protoheme IX farnesyltransferase